MKHFPLNTLIIIFSILLNSCKSQDRVLQSISCADEVIVQYEKTSNLTKKEKLEADKKLESFVVYFLNDFNNNVKGYVNGELLFNEKIETNEVTSDTGKYFGYSYSKDSKAPVLKVSVDKKNACFDIEIDKEYKLIYVFLNQENKWIVRFSNTYYPEH